MDLRDRVALVTGASAGIGLAVCRRLVDAGARVVMVARTRATLEAVAVSLGGATAGRETDGEAAIPWPLDVGDLVALARLPQQVVARCGRLDVVVNNAGLHHRGAVATRTPEELAAMVTVNLAAPIVLARAALPLLPAGGAIVNVASLAGFVPLPDAATYSATKVGLRFFGRALAGERAARERGIAVATVSPGPVDTDFFLGELDRATPVTFSQPMSSADEVAAAVLAAMTGRRQEIALPGRSALLATAGYLWPALLRRLRPRLEKKGARRKAEYAARRGVTGR